MKKYKAIFFDWDGTAVVSRKAPADDACAAMKPLLDRGTPLVIISGTTYENLAGGRLESFFTPHELQNLYLGLGRGAYQYSYTPEGDPHVFARCLPDNKHLLLIHQICFDIHQYLLGEHAFATDIVFTRPNYCKIDLMPEVDRGDQLFMQGEELTALKAKLSYHGITGGLQDLLELAERIGKKNNMQVLSTCDAKYLEVGITSKADNANVLMKRLMEGGIAPKDCAFFGDEYVGIEPGIFGSDALMKTGLTSEADFFDVSDLEGERPEGVQVLGGGVETFLNFLKKQAEL
ncbi:MAG: HAD family hydrolase [Lachnospiraceae bacterium]